ncbi:MAG: hypothetical protein RL641_109 [Candidatus Parcubacteria bacterium]|jgi:hypothetical protein
MIITRLSGGLGNQMFQYAVGRVLSLKHTTELGLDTSTLGKKPAYNNDTIRHFDLDVFGITGRIAKPSEIPFIYRLRSPFLARLFDITIGKLQKKNGVEKKFAFDATILELSNNTYLSGFWQSYKYFFEYEEVIRNDFRLKEKVSEKTQELAKEIQSKNAVCVHVRRGDFVGNVHHETVGKEYYGSAINLLKQKTTIETMYVFSDDIAWCRDHMLFGDNVVYVGQEYAGKKNEEHMYLMSQCKHFIIANSSFSWWSAWLAPYTDKIVIAPKRWFTDESIDTSTLTPPTWIRI